MAVWKDTISFRLDIAPDSNGGITALIHSPVVCGQKIDHNSAKKKKI